MLSEEDIVQALQVMTEDKMEELMDAVSDLQAGLKKYDETSRSDFVSAELAAMSLVHILEFVQNPRDNVDGSDYYYSYSDLGEGQKAFWFVRKDFWNENHYIDDGYDEELVELLPDKFHELMESAFDYYGDHGFAHEWLLTHGFTRNAAVDALVANVG